MKFVSQDRGECRRRWYEARTANLLRLSGEPPKNLCVDEINVTVCCRFAESLLDNSRIARYVAKYHTIRLRELQNLLAEFRETCES
jgi:hypothetical protein